MLPDDFKLKAGEAPTRKPQASAAAPPIADDSPSMPPPAAARKERRPHVIDIEAAAVSISTVPVLDIVRRRVLRDWLRGLRPRQLRTVYQSGPRPLTVDEVDDVLRAEVKREQEAARRRAMFYGARTVQLSLPSDPRKTGTVSKNLRRNAA